LPAALADLMADSGLVASRSAARRLIQQGGARVDDEKIDDIGYLLDREAVIWAGRKKAVRVLQG
jgi:tyrosyl-tRNA synthetase